MGEHGGVWLLKMKLGYLLALDLMGCGWQASQVNAVRVCALQRGCLGSWSDPETCHRMPQFPCIMRRTSPELGGEDFCFASGNAYKA